MTDPDDAQLLATVEAVERERDEARDEVRDEVRRCPHGVVALSCPICMTPEQQAADEVLKRQIREWQQAERAERERDLTAAREVGRALAAALDRIERWEMPMVASGVDGRLVPYGVEHGSNGCRDLVRSWARAALALARREGWIDG